MKEPNKKKEEVKVEETEVTAEKPKPLTPQQLIHQSRTPVFPNANRFGKGAQANNNNNRQRPGRAASRGR